MATTTTTLNDIHPDIIYTHILPRLDGQSLSTTATSSPRLKRLCSDNSLWSQISRSTWPSINDPRVHEVISTFPSGYRSFFDDSFPTIITDIIRRDDHRRSWNTVKSRCTDYYNLDRSSCDELISAVDIRYKDDIIFSKVNVTKITPDFLSSSFGIELNDGAPDPDPTRPGNDLTPNGSGFGSTRSGSGSDPARSDHGSDPTRYIDLTVDEIAGADKETLSHLKESVTLNWILIDPTRKRACNLSSMKPVSARQDWVSNETLIRFVTVLPGCEANEVVKCRINVVLGVGEKGVGLYVKEVTMKLKDLDCGCLNGDGFLRVIEGVISGEKNMRRKVVDDEERWNGYNEFKILKRMKKEWELKEERKSELLNQFNYVAIFVSFFLCIYFGYLLVKGK